MDNAERGARQPTQPVIQIARAAASADNAASNVGLCMCSVCGAEQQQDGSDTAEPVSVRMQLASQNDPTQQVEQQDVQQGPHHNLDLGALHRPEGQTSGSRQAANGRGLAGVRQWPEESSSSEQGGQTAQHPSAGQRVMEHPNSHITGFLQQQPQQTTDGADSGMARNVWSKLEHTKI